MYDSSNSPKRQPWRTDEQVELKAKAREMAEILFEHEGQYKAIPIQHFLPDLEQRVRDFYADHGQWPVFRRDPYGIGLTMGTQAEIDQLPPTDAAPASSSPCL
jgi:hypothetical protein